MTLAAVMFVLGLGVGWIGQAVWVMAVELFDIYREER